MVCDGGNRGTCGLADRLWPELAGVGAAVVLLLAPHVIGAPEPDQFSGPVPTELGALLAARAFGIGAVAWVLTGLFAGHFWRREADREA